MREFVAWMNSSPIMRLHPLVRAALAHYHLGLIHSFRDGNGRTARLLEAMMISASGIKHTGKMLSNYYYTHLDDYYIVIRRCQTNKERNVHAFLDFTMSGTKDRIEYLHDMISSSIRNMVTRDYIQYLRREKHISQRQHDLAMILFSLVSGIKASDLHSSPLLFPLYRQVSEQTARRDLNKLIGLKILTKVANTFFHNTHVMDF
jgi:Fic family protein